jgi:hypothetical protein
MPRNQNQGISQTKKPWQNIIIERQFGMGTESIE